MLPGDGLLAQQAGLLHVVVGHFRGQVLGRNGQRGQKVGQRARLHDAVFVFHHLRGVATKLVSAQNEEEQPDRWYFSPLFVFGLLFSIGIVSLFFEYKRAHYKPVVDSALLLATGLIGVIIFYLMFVSTHPLVKNNLNLLWANPLNLIAAVLIWMKKMRKFMFVYQIFNLALLGLALVALALSVQSFNVALYPVLALLIFRYARWFVRTKHKFERKSKSQRMEKRKRELR